MFLALPLRHQVDPKLTFLSCSLYRDPAHHLAMIPILHLAATLQLFDSKHVQERPEKASRLKPYQFNSVVRVQERPGTPSELKPYQFSSIQLFESRSVQERPVT